VRGEQVIVSKDKGRPRGRGHINGIEGFRSYAKHWLYTYRGVPKSFPICTWAKSLFGLIAGTKIYAR